MESKTIQERIEAYRATRAEWVKRRQVALNQAAEYLAHAHACDGAIEALEGLLPAVPIEDVLKSAAPEV
jgi:hypothetical protein